MKKRVVYITIIIFFLLYSLVETYFDYSVYNNFFYIGLSMMNILGVVSVVSLTLLISDLSHINSKLIILIIYFISSFIMPILSNCLRLLYLGMPLDSFYFGAIFSRSFLFVTLKTLNNIEGLVLSLNIPLVIYSVTSSFSAYVGFFLVLYYKFIRKDVVNKEKKEVVKNDITDNLYSDYQGLEVREYNCKTCPNCGIVINDTHLLCPKCGHNFIQIELSSSNLGTLKSDMNDLSEKLSKLKQAYDLGIFSEEEYKSKRKSIIDTI